MVLKAMEACREERHEGEQDKGAANRKREGGE